MGLAAFEVVGQGHIAEDKQVHGMDAIFVPPAITVDSSAEEPRLAVGQKVCHRAFE